MNKEEFDNIYCHAKYMTEDEINTYVEERNLDKYDNFRKNNYEEIKYIEKYLLENIFYFISDEVLEKSLRLIVIDVNINNNDLLLTYKEDRKSDYYKQLCILDKRYNLDYEVVNDFFQNLKQGNKPNCIKKINKKINLKYIKDCIEFLIIKILENDYVNTYYQFKLNVLKMFISKERIKQ